MLVMSLDILHEKVSFANVQGFNKLPIQRMDVDVVFSSYADKGLKVGMIFDHLDCSGEHFMVLSKF